MIPAIKTSPAEALAQLTARAKALTNGREFDVVAFVQDLLATLTDVDQGLMIQRTVGPGLVFELDSHSRILELPLGAYMLRPICARLAALCVDAGQKVSPYGGEGMLTLTSGRQCRLEFSNQPGDVWLRLTPVTGATA